MMKQESAVAEQPAWIRTFDYLVHNGQDMVSDSLFQHQAMRQIVDVLGCACKMREFQHLHAMYI